MGCLVCLPQPFTASYDFRMEVCRSFTECRKQFLDFKRLSAGICPCKEWASFVSCFAFSTLAHTSRLMLGGAIPDNKYNSSTLVGLRHPVIARYAILSSEFSL